MQILGMLAFVAALLLSVMIHEFGHYEGKLSSESKRFRPEATVASRE